MAGDCLRDCGDRCALYDYTQGGCLIKKALEIYIKEHKLTPVGEKFSNADIDRLIEIMREIPSQQPLYKHPSLNKNSICDIIPL